MFDSSRTEQILGKEAVQKLKTKKIILFGLGGVGGQAAEALCRSGIGSMTLVDGDVVSESNLNRQIAALHSTLGKKKADVLKDRFHDINPDAEFVEEVDSLDQETMQMGKASTGSSSGTGGMNTKLLAAKIATKSGIDMLIANSKDIKVIHRLLAGTQIGTLFRSAGYDGKFDLPLFVERMHR